MARVVRHCLRAPTPAGSALPAPTGESCTQNLEIPGRSRPLGFLMAALTTLIVTSIGIMAASYAWGWRYGAIRVTRQEHFDHEFERIVGRLR